MTSPERLIAVCDVWHTPGGEQIHRGQVAVAATFLPAASNVCGPQFEPCFMSPF